MRKLQQALEQFSRHYSDRFGYVKVETENGTGGIQKCFLSSEKLKTGNGPRIFHHGIKTSDVIILTHGLSDSPYYLQAVADRFFEKGINVIMPLLPAHGLKKPDDAMEDFKLDSKWRDEIDRAVEVAQSFGERISLGGFSTGGALSYNKILRHPDLIGGGLFLFSGAIDVKIVADFGWSRLLQGITRMTDGHIRGEGKDPFKYPSFPNFGAVELGQVIRQNEKLSKGQKIKQPVFAAHSAHDKAAKIDGIIDLLEHYVEIGTAYIISQNVMHASLPLDREIPGWDNSKEGPDEAPKPNPQFDQLMDNALRFFEERIGRLVQ